MKALDKYGAWSSLVEGDEGSYLPNCQTNLVIALHALFLLFCIFINTTAYHLGRYKPSSPVCYRAPCMVVQMSPLRLGAILHDLPMWHLHEILLNHDGRFQWFLGR